jgi:hypothetical protein
MEPTARPNRMKHKNLFRDLSEVCVVTICHIFMMKVNDPSNKELKIIKSFVISEYSSIQISEKSNCLK